MVTVTDRLKRIAESKLKIESPFELDETLCLYSPQDNVDALAHPRIAAWLDFMETAYEPHLPDARRRILLFMPCTKTKPYPFSSEHKAINQRLLDAGFRPVARQYLPQALQARLEPAFHQEVLNLAPLADGHGTLVHRMVISEPLGVVPYEHIATDRAGQPSPATAYDDPGLFENRGNAVSPWRSDSTAVAVSATRWTWGDEERRAYVTMHNAMAASVATCVRRIGHCYDDIVAWVAPGLTHRSFVIARHERAGARRRRDAPRGRETGPPDRGQRPSRRGSGDRLPAHAGSMQARRDPARRAARRRSCPCHGHLCPWRRECDAPRLAGASPTC